ncbi:hypothetical protein EJB05_36869, partial [Eragrostis curvula]
MHAGPWDIAAEEFGLPFLPAFLTTGGSNVSQGVKIEVGFFERNNNLVPFKLVNNSLDVQLGWFEETKPSLCNGTGGYQQDCFSKALFFVGELGVNDYNFIWMSGKTEDEVRTYVPKVVETITMAVDRRYVRPAHQPRVPGNPPTGCSPSGRAPTRRSTTSWAACETSTVWSATTTRCSAPPYPHARIIFADYYQPIIQVLQNRSLFGFGNDDVLKACCGAGGGAYNWDPNAFCSIPG